MKIGIIGHKGRLGSQLVQMGCEPLPIRIEKDMKPIDFPIENSVIINCAALTGVDRCQTDDEYYHEAIETNGFGVRYLAESYKGEIIHISTDYVFRGTRGAYKEIQFSETPDKDLPTNGMGYGITKLLGEYEAGAYDHVKIVRTTGLYGGRNGGDFLRTLLENYELDIPSIPVTKELHGNQTYIPHLADALMCYAEMKDRPKILHIGSKEVISRYEFALMIASVFDLDKKRLKPCKNSEVPGWVAERPKKGGMKVDLAIKLGLPIYTILEGIEEAKRQFE